MTARDELRRWVKIAAIAVPVLLVIVLPNVMLLLFAAVLVSVLLRGLTNVVGDTTHFGETASFTLVVTVLSVVVAGVLWLVASSMAEEIGRFTQELPRAWKDFESWMATKPWGVTARRYFPSGSEMWDRLAGGQHAVGAISSTFGVLADVFVLVFVGLYLAGDHRTYVNGTVRLLPPAQRPRACEVLDTVGATLRRWLVGRFVLMVSNGAVTWIVLMILGIPLPFVLGLLSGLLNFVPNIGPFVAAIPAVLIAFTVSPQDALVVAGFYLVYQMLDGYVLTPLVQRRTVALPPALTITSQVVLGVLLGTMGVLLAVPVVAVLLVVVKMLYLSDVLGEEVTLADRVERAR